MRAALLRNPPIPTVFGRTDRIMVHAIISELYLIKQSSRLTGATKSRLFERGVNQIFAIKPAPDTRKLKTL